MPVNSSQTGLEALLHTVAFVELTDVGWLRVTGEDRVRWLNGMATNSIQSLADGEGCYNYFLNAQGRIQADATAWMDEAAIVLETPDAGRLATILDHFIIMDDVELEVVGQGATEAAGPHDASGVPLRRTGLLLAGPQASTLLQVVSLPQPAPQRRQHATWNEMLVEVLHAHSPLVPRFEVWGDRDVIARVADALRVSGAVEASTADMESLRILEGTPLFGTDIRAKDLPQETNQTRALHFSKGCYLGQEIVERIRSRGAVHRTFHGFSLTGDGAAPGTALYTNDPAKPVGELTSVARIGTATLALGYIRREALDSKATISYAVGTAEPTSLPYTHPTS